MGSFLQSKKGPTQKQGGGKTGGVFFAYFFAFFALQKRQKSKQKICKFYFFAEQKKATLLLQSKAKGTNQSKKEAEPYQRGGARKAKQSKGYKPKQKNKLKQTTIFDCKVE